MDEIEFQRRCDTALEELKQSLITAEEDSDFEVEENNGVLSVVFDEPEGKFVISPNSAVRQIWISALSTSFKLDWTDDQGFILKKTGEALKPLMSRVINQHLGIDSVSLA